MIRSFNDKGLRRFAERGDRSKLSVQKPDRIQDILNALEAATAPGQMNIPGLRFHDLAPARPGTYSVTVSGNWRITFRFSGQDAVDVDLEDYH